MVMYAPGAWEGNSAWLFCQERSLCGGGEGNQEESPAWTFLPNLARAWMFKEFQPSIFKDSRYSSRKYKQRLG